MRIRRQWATWALAGTLGSLAAGTDARAAEGPVFRGLFEDKPMVFVALQPDMSLAYDETGCSLLQAWKGGVVPLSAPAPAGSGQAYQASGPLYHRRVQAKPWSLRGPQGNIPVTPRFDGFSVKEGWIELRFSLGIPGGKRIRILESPAFDDHYGDFGIFRRFTVTGIPKGTSLRLDLDGRGRPPMWGGGGVGRVEMQEGRWQLLQEQDGETPIKVNWVP